ncbi:MAG TPA: hypothetical protein VM364_15695 [Vicinamibacterales bacterium]|nr:hypothetical protein [Vicinamibacterales bacterium]
MRSPLPRAALLVAALLLACPASAQTVDDIVAKNLEAKGGAARLRETTTVRTVARGTSPAGEVRIVSSSKRPHFVLNEMENAGQVMKQGFDGERMWMAVPGRPPQALPPGPQTEAMKQSSQIDSPLLDYKEKGTAVTFAGTTTQGDRREHHLVITPKNGPPLNYYIDAGTWLESRIVVEFEEGGRKAVSEMRLSDYREVDGRMMPFKLRQFFNGTQVGEVTFEKVEFNVPMDDSIFRMPK